MLKLLKATTDSFVCGKNMDDIGKMISQDISDLNINNQLSEVGVITFDGSSHDSH